MSIPVAMMLGAAIGISAAVSFLVFLALEEGRRQHKWRLLKKAKEKRDWLMSKRK